MFGKNQSQKNAGAGALNKEEEHDPARVFDYLKEISKERKFVESIETIIKLNVDPTKGDQMIRGTCILPAGTGKEIKVCVFADSAYHDELREAGADVIGTDAIMADIAADKIEFDKLLCTQEHISELKRYARILGPKGLMPNTKSGTLVGQDLIVEQVRQSKQGLIEFRVSPDAWVFNKIGLRSFESAQLHENFDALMMALIHKRPETLKGRYFLKGMVKSSMGPPIRLDLSHYAQIIAQQSNI